MPTKRRDIVRKVAAFGGWENPARGKGSHRLLCRVDPDVPGRVLTVALKYHGSNKDFPDSVVRSIRNKLKLGPDDGIADRQWNKA